MSSTTNHPVLESQPYPGPLVRVRGRLTRDGHVTWSPALRTFTDRAVTTADRAAAEDGGYVVPFESASGQVLASGPVDPQFPASDLQHASFTTRLPFQPQTARITLRHNGTLIPDPLVVPSQPPRFHLVSPVTALQIDPAGVLHLVWRQRGPPTADPVTYFVRFSADAAGGVQVRPGVNLRSEGYDLDLRQMPGGDHCFVQILGTNGYHTAFVQTPEFALPLRPPELVLGENDGPLLTAQGLSPNHGPLTGDAIRWLVDGEPRSTGVVFDVRGGTGQHTVSVEVTDPDSQVLTEDLGRYDAVTGRRVRPPAGLLTSFLLGEPAPILTLVAAGPHRRARSAAADHAGTAAPPPP